MSVCKFHQKFKTLLKLPKLLQNYFSYEWNTDYQQRRRLKENTLTLFPPSATTFLSVLCECHQQHRLHQLSLSLFNGGTTTSTIWWNHHQKKLVEVPSPIPRHHNLLSPSLSLHNPPALGRRPSSDSSRRLCRDSIGCRCLRWRRWWRRSVRLWRGLCLLEARYGPWRGLEPGFCSGLGGCATVDFQRETL